MKLEDIKRHWEESGARFPYGGAVTPTSRDPFLGELERRNVLDFLRPGFACLEVGCGDAFHTLRYASSVASLCAIDLAESLVAVARRRLSEQQIDNVELQVASVLDTASAWPGRRFDCAISQRCLINLPEWRYQEDAILQIADRLTDGGWFLLTEGFQEPLDRLNELRARFGLPEIVTVDYNRNLVRRDFERFIAEHFEIVERRHYGAYVFLSRLYHPLAVWPDPPVHDSRLNEAAMRLASALVMPDLEQYSYVLFYALRKRARG